MEEKSGTSNFICFRSRLLRNIIDGRFIEFEQRRGSEEGEIAESGGE